MNIRDFEAQQAQYQFHCCRNVFCDADAYPDAELAQVAAGHPLPVFREAARAEIGRREAARKQVEQEAV